MDFSKEHEKLVVSIFLKTRSGNALESLYIYILYIVNINAYECTESQLQPQHIPASASCGENDGNDALDLRQQGLGKSQATWETYVAPC